MTDPKPPLFPTLKDLIVVVNHNRIVSHCGPACYDAKEDYCTCCCGGQNHAKGISLARKNLSATWIWNFVWEWITKNTDLFPYGGSIIFYSIDVFPVPSFQRGEISHVEE